VLFAAGSQDVALAFIELGAIALGLAVLARVSARIGVSPIPAYLLAGLVFGDGGIAAPHLSARSSWTAPAPVGARAWWTSC
jgi:CPA2 family monovalent cation:H+ antiporter-2